MCVYSQGKVHVTAQHDTKFREIEISFAGKTTIYLCLQHVANHYM